MGRGRDRRERPSFAFVIKDIDPRASSGLNVSSKTRPTSVARYGVLNPLIRLRSDAMHTRRPRGFPYRNGTRFAFRRRNAQSLAEASCIRFLTSLVEIKLSFRIFRSSSRKRESSTILCNEEGLNNFRRFKPSFLAPAPCNQAL